MTEAEEKAMSYIPKSAASAVLRAVKPTNTAAKPINELRLRMNGCMSVTSLGENLPADYTCTKDDLAYTVDKLCKSSLYSRAEDIKNGVIPADMGIRAGVCGRAVVEDGRVSCVRDITSVAIRIPHKVPGAADLVLPLCEKYSGVLIYSRPAGGKTTVLRELIPLLAKKYRLAVIDTRFELCGDGNCFGMADIFSGYPRYAGMTSAVRTMSPEFILCDEISTPDDFEAVRYAHSSGVRIAATAHADDLESLLRNETLRGLIKSGIFGCLYGLRGFGNEPVITKSEEIHD